eukprot:m.314173 g.314173  ORF g.314173 m.314173 type:complete len:105 (+) comp15970_c0_seq4:816-1130(+)
MFSLLEQIPPIVSARLAPTHSQCPPTYQHVHSGKIVKLENSSLRKARLQQIGDAMAALQELIRKQQTKKAVLLGVPVPKQDTWQQMALLPQTETASCVNWGHTL